MSRVSLKQLLEEQTNRADFLAQQVRDLAALLEKIKRAEPEAYRRAVRSLT